MKMYFTITGNNRKSYGEIPAVSCVIVASISNVGNIAKKAVLL